MSTTLDQPRASPATRGDIQSSSHAAHEVVEHTERLGAPPRQPDRGLHRSIAVIVRSIAVIVSSSRGFLLAGIDTSNGGRPGNLDAL
jgi:hypothetical protein